jgi:hypothetical protein
MYFVLGTNTKSTNLQILRQDIHNINTRHIPSNIQSKLCCLLNLIKITCLLNLFFYRGFVNLRVGGYDMSNVVRIYMSIKTNVCSLRAIHLHLNGVMTIHAIKLNSNRFWYRWSYPVRITEMKINKQLRQERMIRPSLTFIQYL